MAGKSPVSPALPACGRQVGGVKGYNQNDISLLAFRSPLRVPGTPGVPVPSLRGGQGASLSNRLEGHVGHPVLTDASCERTDKVESEDLLEMKHHRLYR
jgi:hypothetical protein